ncbi:MAG: hypothetical protein HFJ57_03590 [Clostridia bacterium]|nr:hypothetical protein [Clostridia bacterium]
MNKNSKGITLVSLVITIIILMLITSVTVYTGTNVIKQVTLQNVNTDMMLIKAKVKTMEEQAKFNKDNSNYKGTPLIDVHDNKKIDKLVDEEIVEDITKYYLLSKEDLNSMGLEKIDIADGYLVNYESEEIIYVRGLKKDDNMYYKLSDIKDLKY